VILLHSAIDIKRGRMNVMNLKKKIDEYFELEGDTEGQLLYYGATGGMLLVMITHSIGWLFV